MDGPPASAPVPSVPAVAPPRARVGIRDRLRFRRTRRWVAARFAHRRAPIVMLALVCVLGLGVRVLHLGNPANSGPGQGYVFDEKYYVSAARVIAGLPNAPQDAYDHASPKGTDPNGEHPQLGKLVIAGSISLFGDNAIGWRVTAVAFGLAALLLLYWLVRSAGGGRWTALAAVAIASFENLWVVHSRIAVLDIYVVPFMLAGAALYLRRRWVLGGIVIGIGCCVKEFGVYVPLVLILFELVRTVTRARARRAGDRSVTRGAIAMGLARPVLSGLVAGVTFFTVLSGLDALVTPYSGGRPVDRHQSSLCDHLWIWSKGCNHFVFMDNYAGRLHGEQGIASAPTRWLINQKSISYYTVTRTVSSGGKVRSHTKIVWYRGELSRVLLFTCWLALVLCVWWALRRGDDLAALAVAWALGTWIPPEVFHLVDNRTTYLYYMVVSMPALYLAAARLFAARRVHWLLIAVWFAVFLWDFAGLYPFRTLAGT